MNLLDGKKIASQIIEQLKDTNADIVASGHKAPHLVCIIVGDDPASKIYVKSKEKACKQLGFTSSTIILPSNSTEDMIKYTIMKLNKDKSVSGILLQLPLPKGFHEREIVNTIDPSKDVDCLTDVNLGKLVSKTNDIAPCTAQGIMTLLHAYSIPIEGKHAVVIGRSLLVGKSVANLLEQENATVTLCHSKTKNLAQFTKNADILVVAIGKEKYITQDFVKDGAVVIDVGINRTEQGIVGDVDFENVQSKCSYITPVPGGVGKMTIAELMRNTLTLYTLQNDVALEQDPNLDTDPQSNK